MCEGFLVFQLGQSFNHINCESDPGRRRAFQDVRCDPVSGMATCVIGRNRPMVVRSLDQCVPARNGSFPYDRVFDRVVFAGLWESSCFHVVERGRLVEHWYAAAVRVVRAVNDSRLVESRSCAAETVCSNATMRCNNGSIVTWVASMFHDDTKCAVLTQNKIEKIRRLNRY